MIKLFTERLIIRDLEIIDLENHHKLLSDKNVMYYLQDIQTNNLEESKENLNNAINAGIYTSQYTKLNNFL